MAIFKGRSVQIISTTPMVEPSITIAHKDGDVSTVKPSDLLFTKVELDRMIKDITTKFTFNPKDPNYNANYKLIEDKDHQELLDGQDPVKMEKKVKATVAPEVMVPAQTIKVATPVVSPVVGNK